MRLVGRSISCFYAVAWTLSACSADQNDTKATSKTVITLSPAAVEVLYWQDQKDIVRGNCMAGKPVHRSNCTLSVMRLSLAELNQRVKERSQQKLNLLSKEIMLESETLLKSDVTVQSLHQQIAALLRHDMTLRANVADLMNDLHANTELSAKFANQLIDYMQQLRAIELQLRDNPRDPYLLTLQTTVQTEQANCQKQKQDADQRVGTTQRRLELQTPIFAQIESNLKAKQYELKTYLEELELYSPKLEQLKHEERLTQRKITLVPQVLASITNDDISYRDDIWSVDLRGALALINQAFSGSLGLRPGVFKLESGYRDFCPQKTTVTMGADLDVVFLPPCSSAEKIHVCEKDVCKNAESGTVIKVRDETHYEFLSSGYTGVFALDAGATLR